MEAVAKSLCLRGRGWTQASFPEAQSALFFMRIIFGLLLGIIAGIRGLEGLIGFVPATIVHFGGQIYISLLQVDMASYNSFNANDGLVQGIVTYLLAWFATSNTAKGFVPYLLLPPAAMMPGNVTSSDLQPPADF